MVNQKILNETQISMCNLKEEIEEIKKRDKEISFRTQRTEEYLNQFLTLKPKEGREIVAKLINLNIPRIKEHHIFKIADLMPNKPQLVKLIFQGSPVTITDDNAKKIANIVNEYKK